MTLEEKAEAGYKSHAGEMGYNDGTRHKLYFDGFKDGYRAAGKVTWHDLRKNPEDLPPNEHEVYVAVVNETARGKELIYGFDRYLTDDEAWFIESAQEIIAWCEIPKFEE